MAYNADNKYVKYLIVRQNLVENILWKTTQQLKYLNYLVNQVEH